MRIFYLFILFLSACFIWDDVPAGQMPVRPFKKKVPLLPSQDLSMDDGEEYGDDELDEGMTEDRLPPSGPKSLQAKRPSSRRNGFQQKSGMRAPERLAAMPEDMDEMEDDGGLPNSLENEEPMPGSAQLPPRDYPPKMPELKFGQIEWNQMDLHSLVEGRKS